MNKEKMRKLAIIFAIPIIVCLIPTPEGLSNLAWILFGLYAAAIVGLVLKPYPEPVILLATVAVTAVVVGNFGVIDGKRILASKDVLSGYASTTTWLVFSAFTLSAAFVTTGLGRRIAYHLIRMMGSTTLGLGYVTAFLDLIIAPATPSNTARAGGIVFPIINSVAPALGSDPVESPRKAGHYLMVNIYMVTKATSYMFVTAMAPNALALSMMAPILGIELSWKGWALAAMIPGIVCLLLTPIVIYLMYPPDLKKVDNKAISDNGLKELGPITLREKMLLTLFVLALGGWIFSKQLGVDATTVALFVMGASLVIGLVTWDDVLKNKGGWNTLIWFGGIIGMSSVLTKAGFFKWLASILQSNMHFGDNDMLALVVIMLISVSVRYLFASGSAYVAAMIPVFAVVGNAAFETHPEFKLLLALGLLFSNSYGGALTHYGGAAAPIVFAAGYNDVKSWWIIGAVIGFGSLFIHLTLGVWWWDFLISSHPAWLK